MFSNMGTPKCSTCHNPTGIPGQRLCATCKAAYMRRWRKTTQTLRDAKISRRALEALKASLVQTFERLGPSEMTGYTAAEIIRTAEPK